MRCLLCLFVLSPALALADNYAVGTSFDGYTRQSDGYWYRGSSAYTLTRSKVYSGYNCYYYKNYFYPVPVIYKDRVVEKVIEKPVYPEVKVQKGWRDKLLEMAEARDTYEQKQKDAERDHKEYLETIKALGFDRSGIYAQGKGYAATYSTSYYPNAAQGNTVYGYSLSSVTDVYGDNQVGVWMQQAARAQSAAQVTAEKGLGGIFEAINTEGNNRARVAEILAKAQLLKSLDREEFHTQTKVEVQGAVPPGSEIPPPPEVKPLSGDIQGVFHNHCVKCHSQQETIKGKSDLFPNGVDLGQYQSFSVDQKKRVLSSVLSGEMPKGGKPLSIEDTSLIYADVIAAIAAAKQPAKAD